MWDKNKPAGSQKLRLADDDIRANNEALETAISEGHEFATGGSQTGKHTTPTFKDNVADPAQPTGTNEVRLYNKGRVLYTLADNGEKRGVNKNTDIPAGTKMLFKQNSAPAGWTFLSEDNDRVLLNTSTESDGGWLGGSWTISGISVQEHTLTIDEMPRHTHDVMDGTGGNETGSITVDGGNFSGQDYRVGWVSSDTYTLIKHTGGDQPHGHGINLGNTWRPAYVKVITCQKD